MTCRRSDIYWRDALYNAVCQVPGSVQAAAAYLSARRGRGITGEALRKKLRGLEGESVSVEIAEMLTEFLQEHVDSSPSATDWIASLGVQFDLMIDYVPPAPVGGWANELEAFQKKLLELHSLSGRLASAGIDTLEDGRVSLEEVDRIQDLTRELRTLSFRIERNARRALRKQAESA
ncbi:hypothetical protein E5C33_07490 [Stenotrophomonas maltophilia]|nr:hypothetical protein E5C33_07490 [Stenotrophomonas maltophilia]